MGINELPSYDSATPAEIDALLSKLSSEDLVRIIEQVGTVPMREWRQLTAAERRALGAQNVLARKERVRRSAIQDDANAFERKAIRARMERDEQARADLAPIVEKKRRELTGGW